MSSRDRPLATRMLKLTLRFSSSPTRWLAVCRRTTGTSGRPSQAQQQVLLTGDPAVREPRMKEHGISPDFHFPAPEIVHKPGWGGHGIDCLSLLRPSLLWSHFTVHETACARALGHIPSFQCTRLPRFELNK